MPDEVKKFCGNCYWYDADDDHRSIGWCVERKCKTGFFSVCKNHKFLLAYENRRYKVQGKTS